MRMCSAPLNKKQRPAHSRRMGRFCLGPALLPALLFCCVMVSCGHLNVQEEPAEKPVARAGDENLTMKQYSKSLVTGETRRDSAYAAKKTIETWATEALFYQEALD